jgi:hypothetical protein
MFCHWIKIHPSAARGMELFWNPFGRWAYGAETCQCSGGDVFIDGAPRAIDCDVRVWSVVHFIYGWLFTQRKTPLFFNNFNY